MRRIRHNCLLELKLAPDDQGSIRGLATLVEMPPLFLRPYQPLDFFIISIAQVLFFFQHFPVQIKSNGHQEKMLALGLDQYARGPP